MAALTPSLEGLQLQPEQVWTRVQELLRERMSQPSFETWIHPLRLLALDESRAQLVTRCEFNRNTILSRHKAEIKEAFASVLGHSVELSVTIDSTLAPVEPIEPSCPEEPRPEPLKASRPWTPRSTQSNLNPRYIFDAFVVGQHNRFCHAAALAVAETPAQSYNPFFIHGGVGLGKTHLMQAIGHFALQHHADLQVRYVTAEQFTNDFVAAIRNKGMKAFHDKFRRNDILIIDDVQILESRKKTQEEMFHLFNTLHESGKQIILSSDRSPKRLTELSDRLRSRFEWGLIADIQPADLETRLAILQKKVEREKFAMPEDVLVYMAEMFPHNIRELEGALTKVAAFGMLTRTPIDLMVAQQVLGTPVDAARISLDEMLETVASYYHMRASDLKSPSRAKDVSHARQVGIYVIRTLSEASFPKIGELLGGRKHTTILYAFEKIKDELTHHPVLKQQIEEIKLRLKH